MNLEKFLRVLIKSAGIAWIGVFVWLLFRAWDMVMSLMSFGCNGCPEDYAYLPLAMVPLQFLLYFGLGRLWNKEHISFHPSLLGILNLHGLSLLHAIAWPSARADFSSRHWMVYFLFASIAGIGAMAGARLELDHDWPRGLRTLLKTTILLWVTCALVWIAILVGALNWIPENFQPLAIVIIWMSLTFAAAFLWDRDLQPELALLIPLIQPWVLFTLLPVNLMTVEMRDTSGTQWVPVYLLYLSAIVGAPLGSAYLGFKLGSRRVPPVAPWKRRATQKRFWAI